MYKYTYKDVIIDPNDPRVEIGKEYYFADNPSSVLYQARSGSECNKGTLKMVYKDWDDPFVETSDERFVCLIRKKEPEKKYVPFDLTKEEDKAKLRGAWVRHKNSGREHVITGLYLDETPPYVEINDNGYEPEYLLEEYEFVDGSPCGKLVEESL